MTWIPIFSSLSGKKNDSSQFQILMHFIFARFLPFFSKGQYLVSGINWLQQSFATPEHFEASESNLL